MAIRKVQREQSLSNRIQYALIDTLLYDPRILEAAETLGIAEDECMVWDKKGWLVFYLKENSFEGWKERHQDAIGVTFICGQGISARWRV